MRFKSFMLVESKEINEIEKLKDQHKDNWVSGENWPEEKAIEYNAQAEEIHKLTPRSSEYPSMLDKTLKHPKADEVITHAEKNIHYYHELGKLGAKYKGDYADMAIRNLKHWEKTRDEWKNFKKRNPMANNPPKLVERSADQVEKLPPKPAFPKHLENKSLDAMSDDELDHLHGYYEKQKEWHQDNNLYKYVGNNRVANLGVIDILNKIGAEQNRLKKYKENRASLNTKVKKI